MLRIAVILTMLSASGAWAESLIKRDVLETAASPGNPEYIVQLAHLVVMPGGTIPLHTHPGDEYLYVLEGGSMKHVDGRTLPFRTGMHARFPEGMVHGGLTNVGDAPIVAVTTHVVDKNLPLSMPAE